MELGQITTKARVIKAEKALRGQTFLTIGNHLVITRLFSNDAVTVESNEGFSIPFVVIAAEAGTTSRLGDVIALRLGDVIALNRDETLTLVEPTSKFNAQIVGEIIEGG